MMDAKDIPLSIPVTLNGHPIPNLSVASVSAAFLAAGYTVDINGITYSTLKPNFAVGGLGSMHFVSKNRKATADWYISEGCIAANSLYISMPASSFNQVQANEDEVLLADVLLGEWEYYNKVKDKIPYSIYNSSDLSTIDRGIYEYELTGVDGHLAKIHITLRNGGETNTPIGHSLGQHRTRVIVEAFYGIRRKHSILEKIGYWYQDTF